MEDFTPHMADALPKQQHGAHRLAYRVSELADATGLSDWFVRREIQNRKLKARKVGGAVLVLHDDAVIWLASQPHVIEENVEIGVST